jgi:predicted nucleic acid-binding protein
MILCDTNIFIELYKNNHVVTQTLRSIGVEKIAVSDVTIAELYYGAFNKTELHQIKNHLSSIHHFPLTETVSQTFLNLMESYALSHKISVPDALIAATALSNNVELYSLNLKDFRFIPDLNLFQPVMG